MLNLTKEIQSIAETNENLSRDEDNLKEKSLTLLPTSTITTMMGKDLTISTKRNNKREENSKDIFTEIKKIDGELLFHTETVLKFKTPFD